jgi:serine/threonine-protein kinase HipA
LFLDASEVQHELAQNRQGVFFQYQSEYLERFASSGNLSPYKLKADTSLHPAPMQPHLGVHGVFADSLPDGWGLLLQDRFFRQHNLPLVQITAMEQVR